MKVLMIIDMEGCFGVTNLQDYESSRDRMIEETKNIIDCLIINGISEITVVDSHDRGNNLEKLKKVYSDIVFVSHIWNLQNIEQYEKAILIGMHAMSGVCGNFSHTYRPEIKVIKSNNCEIGEVGLLTNYLAKYNVRVCCISGDISAKKEAEELGISFFATNGVEIQLNDVKNVYQKVVSCLCAGIISESIGVQKYQEYEIEIIFKNKEIVSFLSSYIFDKTVDGIIFKNVVIFYARLSMLSKYLNLYYDIKLEMLFRLKKISCLKWSKEEYSIICDDKCKNILRKQIDDINRMDMMYLVNHFKEYDESSYWDLVCY